MFQVSVSNKETDIPLTYLTVTNDNPDNNAPKISNLRFDPTHIRAGERGKFVFSAHDDDPAFVVNDIYPTARHKFSTAFQEPTYHEMLNMIQPSIRFNSIALLNNVQMVTGKLNLRLKSQSQPALMSSPSMLAMLWEISVLPYIRTSTYQMKI